MARPLALLLLLLAVPFAPLAAQDRDVPYWATLRASEVNMRVGPSEDFPIAWVYRRAGLPVKVLRVTAAREPSNTVRAPEPCSARYSAPPSRPT